jgi:hypothetical protein
MTKGTNSLQKLSALLQKNKITKNRIAKEAEEKKSGKKESHKHNDKVVKPKPVVQAPVKAVPQKSYQTNKLKLKSDLESMLKMKNSANFKPVPSTYKKFNKTDINLLQASLVNKKSHKENSVLHSRPMNHLNLKSLKMMKPRLPKLQNKIPLKSIDPTQSIDDQIIDLSNQIQTEPAINWTGRFNPITDYEINDGYNRNGTDYVVTDKVYTYDTSRDHTNYGSTTGDALGNSISIYAQLAPNKLNNDVYAINGTDTGTSIDRYIYKFSNGIKSIFLTATTNIKGITVINNHLYYIKAGVQDIFIKNLDNGNESTIINNAFNVTNSDVVTMTGNNTDLFIIVFHSSTSVLYRVNLATNSINNILTFSSLPGYKMSCALDTHKNLYILYNAKVDKLSYNSINNTYNSTLDYIVDSNHQYIFYNGNGPVGDSTFSRTPYITAMAVDERNYMYVVDSFGSIFRMNLDGDLTYKRSIVGNPDWKYWQDNSDPGEIRFNYAQAIGVKNQNKIYLIDYTSLRTLTIPQIFDHNVETPLTQLPGMFGVDVLSTQLASINNTLNNENDVADNLSNIIQNDLNNINDINNGKLSNIDSSIIGQLDNIHFRAADSYSNVINPEKLQDNGDPEGIEVQDVNDSNVYFMRQRVVSETFKLADHNQFVTYENVNFDEDTIVADTLHRATANINNMAPINVIDHVSPTIIYDISNVTLLNYVISLSGSIDDNAALVNGYLMGGNLYNLAYSEAEVAVENDFRYTVDLANNVSILEIYDGTSWSNVLKSDLESQLGLTISEDNLLVFNNAVVNMPANIQSTPNNNNVRFTTVPINLVENKNYMVRLADSNIMLIHTITNANILLPNAHADISIMSDLSGNYYLDENNSNIYYYNNNGTYIVMDTIENNNYYYYKLSNDYQQCIATIDSSNNIYLNQDVLYVVDMESAVRVISNQHNLASTYFIVTTNSDNILYKTDSDSNIDEVSETTVNQFSDSSDLYRFALNNGGSSYFDKIGYTMTLSTPPDAYEYYYDGTYLYDRNNNIVTDSDFSNIILDLDGEVLPLGINNNNTTYQYIGWCVINGSQLFSLVFKNMSGLYEGYAGNLFNNIDYKYIKNKSDFLIFSSNNLNGYIELLEKQNPTNSYILDPTNGKIYQTDAFGKIIPQVLTDSTALTNEGSNIVIYVPDLSGDFDTYRTYVVPYFGRYYEPIYNYDGNIIIQDGSNLYIAVKMWNNIVMKPQYMDTLGPSPNSIAGQAHSFMAIQTNVESESIVYYFNRSDAKLIPYWSSELLQVLGEKPTNFIDYENETLWKIDPNVDTNNIGVISQYPQGIYALHNDSNNSIVTTLKINKPSLYNGQVVTLPLVFIVDSTYKGQYYSNGPIDSGLEILLSYVGNPIVQYRYETTTLGQTLTTNYPNDRIIAYGTYTDNSGTYNNVLVYYDATTLTFSKDDSRVANKFYLGNDDILYKSQSNSGLLDYMVEDLAWVTFRDGDSLNSSTYGLFSEGTMINNPDEGTMVYVESSDAEDPNHNPAQNGLKMYAYHGDSDLIWRAVSGSA